jgi:DNA-binding XRE family transcriptional regulator
MRIRAAMLAGKFSQKDVADKAGVGEKTVQRIERDNPNVTKQMRMAVAQALGVEYDPATDPAPERRGPRSGSSVAARLRAVANKHGLSPDALAREFESFTAVRFNQLQKRRERPKHQPLLEPPAQQNRRTAK